jgi:DNA repair protein RadC
MSETPEHERPRERLIKVGPGNLSDVELLSVIISRGTKGMPVREIAQRLMNQFRTFGEVSRASVEELMRVPGIGQAKACQIVAAFEFARRADDTPYTKERSDMSNPEDVARFARSRVKEPRKECFLCVYLDSRNRLVGTTDVSVGCLDTTLAHPREVFEKAIRASAAAVIVVHNHPSGDPTPSDDDIRLTRRLVEAGKILGIRVHDHIIVAGNSHYSFRGHALV